MKKIIVLLFVSMSFLGFAQKKNKNKKKYKGPDDIRLLVTPIPTQELMSNKMSFGASIQYLNAMASETKLTASLKDFREAYKKREKYLGVGFAGAKAMIVRMQKKVRDLQNLQQTLELENNRQKNIFFKRKKRRRKKLVTIGKQLEIINNQINTPGVLDTFIYGEKLNQLMDVTLALQPLQFELDELDIALNHTNYMTKVIKKKMGFKH